MKVVKRGIAKNLAVFSMMVGNRTYKESHAVELARDISEHNMLEINPVICVNDKGLLRVVDGQHRVGAAKILGIEVPYVVVDGLTAEDIARLNRNQKGWSTRDYLKHYCDMQNKEYIELAKFIEDTGLPVTLSAHMACGNMAEGGANIQFKIGKFKASNIERARMTWDVLSQMERAGCSFVRDRSLVKAVSIILDTCNRFDVKRLCGKLRSMPLEKRASWRDYAVEIERRYNYREQVKNRAWLLVEIEKSDASGKDAKSIR